MFQRLLAVCSFVMLFTPATSADEQMDNPEYANWRKFMKGTSITRVSTSTEPGGRKSVVTEMITLVDVETEKAVLAVEFISDVPGSPRFKTKPKNRDIPKTVTLPAGVKKNDVATKLPGAIEEGKDVETVKVPGGEFKAKWFKTKIEKGKRRIEGKSWVSDEIPGRIVKVEETTFNDGQLLYTTVREVIEIKKP